LTQNFSLLLFSPESFKFRNMPGKKEKALKRFKLKSGLELHQKVRFPIWFKRIYYLLHIFLF
jgi:hypothetical protein